MCPHCEQDNTLEAFVRYEGDTPTIHYSCIQCGALEENEILWFEMFPDNAAFLLTDTGRAALAESAA
jgi:hypothetical protein